LPSTEHYGTGRRKTSTARVFLRPGTGTITVNHREFTDFFPTDTVRMQVRRPLELTESTEKFDIIARALLKYDGELRRPLKKDGLLTTDSRIKERKKYGLAGARKRFQFSKR
jgi:small subunit ribosomal protein S9